MSITIEELSKKTVMELKAYGKKNNIDLFGANTKLEILETIASFFPPEPEKNTKEEKNKAEKVAIYTERNIHMDDLKPIKVGYNIVTKEESEKWLTHRLVRLASPEEVASYYGK
jgi:hypothetical protein